MNRRRNFLRDVFSLGAASAASKLGFAAQANAQARVPVQSPDVADLPFTLDNGVKVFNLIAEPVKQQIAPGKIIDAWGFNGSAPGPTIQVNQGDRVRVLFDNRLPEPTAMHWHGFEIPHAMDGGPGISQDPVKPGERFIYEFTLHQAGTFFYHSHMAMQEMMGMLGAFIMHPKEPHTPRVDKDFVVCMQEYAVLPNNTVPNSMSMEYNWLTFNGKSGPASTPLVVRLGDRVRIRLINLGMDHHPIHLHGHTFYVTGTEGGRIPEAGWYPGNTVLVGVAQSRDVEFVANNPGDWMIHCHLPHHMMNQMSSNVGPLTRLGTGMPAGVSMEEGMGMLTATPDASLGRGMGVGSTHGQAIGNAPLSPEKAMAAMPGMQMPGMKMEDMKMPGMQHDPAPMPGMQHEGMQMGADVSPNANRVPGFPQDAYMESAMMQMDDAVKKPLNHGLRPGWSGFMQGMMSFVRVLPPDKYDEVMDQVRQSQSGAAR